MRQLVKEFGKQVMEMILVNPTPFEACVALARCHDRFGNKKDKWVVWNILGKEIYKCEWDNGTAWWKEFGWCHILGICPW